MTARDAPDAYDSWYATPRGAWMGGAEARLLLKQLAVRPGATLLDAGGGTGWFAAHCARAGAAVTLLDRDARSLEFARRNGRALELVCADMMRLPFPDRSFDAVAAVTSLCFVAAERAALAELVRVARRRVVLGLLHRYSLLYLRKHGRGAYAGARWHTRAAVRALPAGLPRVRAVELETILFWPGGPRLGRLLERVPGLRRFGGFMAVAIELEA